MKIARLFHFCIILLFITGNVYGQESMPGPVIICPNLEEDMHTKVNLPAGIQIDTASSRLAATTFQVTYNGFPIQAQLAFQHAVDIWESVINSPVPIRLTATWQELETSTLASAGTSSLYRNFAGTLRPDVWYPVALAESLSARELNATTDADITVIVNSNINWYLGRDGNTLAGRYDLVTIVLHEIAHGLGIFSSTDVMANTGSWGAEGYPFIYDLFVENQEGERLTNTAVFSNPSARLRTQLTSNSLFFNAPMVIENIHERAQLYAPPVFEAGSSISHLDEFAFPAGNPNSLMTPRIGRAESIQSPGEILLSMLMDLGWETDIPGAEPIVLRVYPNPTPDVLTVSARFKEAAGQFSISIINSIGQVILAHSYYRRTRTFSDRIDLTTLPTGIYYVHVKGNAEASTQKVLVKR